MHTSDFSTNKDLNQTQTQTLQYAEKHFQSLADFILNTAPDTHQRTDVMRKLQDAYLAFTHTVTHHWE